MVFSREKRSSYSRKASRVYFGLDFFDQGNKLSKTCSQDSNLQEINLQNFNLHDIVPVEIHVN